VDISRGIGQSEGLGGTETSNVHQIEGMQGCLLLYRGKVSISKKKKVEVE
jgi:hypothetical protein